MARLLGTHSTSDQLGFLGRPGERHGAPRGRGVLAPLAAEQNRRLIAEDAPDRVEQLPIAR